MDDDRVGDVGQHVSELATAKPLLDFEPSVGLENGLMATIKWHAEHPAVLAEMRVADR